MSAPTASTRSALVRRGLRLEYFTVGWNAAEAVVAIAAGLAAGSVALVGFGLDSVVESLSGAAMIWGFSVMGSGGRDPEEVEERLQRMVALAFFALVVYIVIRSGVALIGEERPEVSVVGMILNVVAPIVMVALAAQKRRVGLLLGSRAMLADAKQTLVCVWLSVSVLLGLVANALFGWWWADPVAGFVIAGFAAHEGLELWRGEGHHGHGRHEDDDDDAA